MAELLGIVAVMGIGLLVLFFVSASMLSSRISREEEDDE